VVTVLYFAGARAAAGTSSEEVAPATLGALLGALADRHGDRLRTVLAAASYLVDGTAARDREALVPAGATLDVLPPFAGG